MGRPPKSDVDLAPFGVNLRAAIERSPHFRNRAAFLRHHATEGATLYRYERGERPPPLDLVQAFAESLDVSVSELVGDVRVELDDATSPYPDVEAFIADEASAGREIDPRHRAELRALRWHRATVLSPYESAAKVRVMR